MPTWNAINSEIDVLASAKACDQVRQKYLKALSAHGKRSVIAYYSGWLQKRNSDGTAHPEVGISDHDMNGFMAVTHALDRTRGLDLVLHTPGGGIEAARAIVEYLFKMFGRDIRVIVPHMAMSAGTMIACAARSIVLGKHSCLGPTDPHIRGLAAMGIIAEIDRAIEEIRKDAVRGELWRAVFNKYPPAFISDCERSIDGTRDMVRTWLKTGMMAGAPDPEAAAQAAIGKLMDYDGTSGHDHHFLADKCRDDIGLTIESLEADQALQDAVLSVHHAFMASFSRAKTIKIIENSDDSMWTVNT